MNHCPRFIPCPRPILILACLMTLGCQLEDENGFGFGGGVVSSDDMPDLGMGDAMCEIEDGTDATCGPDIDELCSLVGTAMYGCIDVDGDCYPSDCKTLPEPWTLRTIQDCNDQNPGTHPGQVEFCDGFDNNCDGQTDENFQIGQACDACGGGVLECSVIDQTATACSTLPGQSQATDDAQAEQCNEIDDDCDGRVDEQCILVQSNAKMRHSPLICGSSIVFVEDRKLLTVELSQPMPTPTLIFEDDSTNPGEIRRPSCADEGIAWLVLRGPCANRLGPTTCEAEVWVKPMDQAPRAMTAISQVGAPRWGGGFVYWHTQIGDRIDVQRMAMDAQAPKTIAQRVSDPFPLRDQSRLAVRRWDDGQARVITVDVADGAERQIPNPPGSTPGAPFANDAWLAWTIEGTTNGIWVVPLDEDPPTAFQAIRQREDIYRFKVVNQVLAYLTETASGSVLNVMDLENGQIRTRIESTIQGQDFDCSEDLTVWLEPSTTDDPGAHLRIDRTMGTTP